MLIDQHTGQRAKMRGFDGAKSSVFPETTMLGDRPARPATAPAAETPNTSATSRGKRRASTPHAPIADDDEYSAAKVRVIQASLLQKQIEVADRQISFYATWQRVGESLLKGELAIPQMFNYGKECEGEGENLDQLSPVRDTVA